jgi:hypothetical protein
MKHVSKVFLAAFLFAGFCSCISYNKGMQSPSSKVEFNKENFEFSEQVTAEAVTVKVFGVDWASLFNSKTGDFNGSIISSSAIPFTDKTANKAVYKFLEQNPGYDVVFYPSVESKTFGIPLIVRTTKAKVTARLAKIKE